ncbi:hypothetical protein LPB140_11190 [Sphingorhabdus lutea]|uniref:Nucleotidyltransferase family protein n=1 Tax=Sphingorhabdus lutea TaxID=1913578 RepID=A0A1L3JFA0_9SPHN|nr:nucleotidyltransferase family protein [Sphingorhabdus lutea]APG63817.1 hypothetical protein LPB140_11190 [Sphingorhabdus lutea]
MVKPINNAQILADSLRNPGMAATFDHEKWTNLLTIARAELLIGSLAHQLQKIDVPPSVRAILDDAIITTTQEKRISKWEARCAALALAPLTKKMVLLKGAAYAIGDLPPVSGRYIGDLDILLPREMLRPAEPYLIKAGWHWVKESEYDDAYYRNHMHELPPLIHADRDRMIDVHHTILPLTAKPRPDAAALWENAVQYDGNLYALCPTDMVVHCAAHLMADGDLSGGMRNLWDFHLLIQHFCEQDAGFIDQLKSRADHHQLGAVVARCARISAHLYGTGIGGQFGKMRFFDKMAVRRILARNGYGQMTRKWLRLAFYIRSHWLRMPPIMLSKHLWTKWRSGHKSRK